MLAAAEGLGSSVFHLRYDDYVHQPARLRTLFDWLGLVFDEARVRKVMERKYAQIPGARREAAAVPPTDAHHAEGLRPS